MIFSYIVFLLTAQLINSVSYMFSSTNASSRGRFRSSAPQNALAGSCTRGSCSLVCLFRWAAAAIWIRCRGALMALVRFRLVRDIQSGPSWEGKRIPSQQARKWILASGRREPAAVHSHGPAAADLHQTQTKWMAGAVHRGRTGSKVALFPGFRNALTGSCRRHIILLYRTQSVIRRLCYGR